MRIESLESQHNRQTEEKRNACELRKAGQLGGLVSVNVSMSKIPLRLRRSVISYRARPEARPVSESSHHPTHGNHDVSIVLLPALLTGVENNASHVQLTTFGSAKVARRRDPKLLSVGGSDWHRVSDCSRASQLFELW